MKPTLTLLVLASIATVAACADDDSYRARGSLAAASEKSAPRSSEFPLQMWMKATVQSAMATGDVGSLASGFERLSTFAPEAYGNWEALSARGATAARSGDLEACRAACKQCHDEYRDRYRAEHRSRALKAK